MDRQHPNHRGEPGPRALTSSPGPPVPPEQPTGDAGEQVVNRRLAAVALGRLTREHRDVLRECYFLGSSVQQAADALGIGPGTVKSRAYYALRALGLAIEELRNAE